MSEQNPRFSSADAAERSWQSFLDLLHLPGLSRASDGFRAYCPFHRGSSGKTLWVAGETGMWGCWSTRCAFNRAHKLSYLAEMRGVPASRYESIIAQLPLLPPGEVEGSSLLEGEREGRFSNAHLWAWAFPWESFYESPDPQVHAAAMYLLRERNLCPRALNTMGVTLDPRVNELVFPVRSSTGELRGVAKRGYPQGSYRLNNSFKLGQHLPVKRGDCLWGWYEQLPQIREGKPIHVVEGYVDQLRFMGMNMVAVAKLGKRLTAEHVQLLNSVSNPVVLVPDADVDGLEGGRRDAVALAPRPNTEVALTFPFKDAGEVPPLELPSLINLNRGSVFEFIANHASISSQIKLHSFVAPAIAEE